MTEDSQTYELTRADKPGGLELHSGDFDADRAIGQMKKRADFLAQIRIASLNALGPQDWVDQNGKPYLQGTGAEKIKALWGIYFKDVSIEPSAQEIRDALLDDRQITVECIGTAGSRVTGEESVFIGSRSSDDSFFGGQQDKRGRLDPGHLRKAAYTNFEVNAISRLLGLRNLSWNEIKSAGHGATTAAASVQYGKQAEDGEGLASKIWKCCLDLNGGDEASAREYLQRKSAFRGKDGTEVKGITSFKNVSEKRLQSIYGRVKKEWEDTYDTGESGDAPA